MLTDSSAPNRSVFVVIIGFFRSNMSYNFMRPNAQVSMKIMIEVQAPVHVLTEVSPSMLNEGTGVPKMSRFLMRPNTPNFFIFINLLIFYYTQNTNEF